MNRMRAWNHRKRRGAAVVLLAAALVGPRIAPAADPAAGGTKRLGGDPATVENARPETALTTVTLTPKAEERLGIVLAKLEEKTVPRERFFGGEVLLPLGDGGKATATIHDLVPRMTPDELVKVAGLQAEAEARLRQAEVRVEAAHTAYKRAEQLAGEGAGSAKTFDEARAELAFAQAALAGAKAQRDLLGASVFDSAGKDRLWVRVPVYAGDVERLATDADARLGGLADRPGAPSLEAKPVDVPFSATGAAVTVDLYYAFQRPAGKVFHPGQKVGVRIPLRGEGAPAKVVPWSAVLHDIHGGTWVYEKVGPQTFRRTRIVVRAVVGEDAVLAQGPAAGAEVVAVGAAEIFGTEFGVGK